MLVLPVFMCVTLEKKVCSLPWRQLPFCKFLKETCSCPPNGLCKGCFLCPEQLHCSFLDDSPSSKSLLGFPSGSVVKNPPVLAGDLGSIAGWGRSPGGGHGSPLQYSCLENPMDRGAWRAAVHGVTVRRDWSNEARARSRTHTHTHTHTCVHMSF